MPFTHERVHKYLERTEPSIEGEEGILTKIKLNNKTYYAKQWRGKHFERNNSIVYSKESRKSPVSPFWFKLKYYESDLIHEAFPEMTLKVHAAFDPRVSTDEGPLTIQFDSGQPITLTSEIPSESPAREQRDRIILSVYAMWKQGEQIHDDGKMNHTNGGEKRNLAALADNEMETVFGKDLAMGNFDWDHPQESLQRIIQRIERINPQSRVLDLLRAGLLPIHPQFNFLPIAPSDEKGPNGYFIEIAVADLELLQHTLESRGIDKKKLKKKILHYIFLRKCDEVYDDIFYSRHIGDQNPWKKNEKIENIIFQKLEHKRREWEKQGEVSKLDLEFTNLKQKIIFILVSYDTENEIIDALSQL